MIGSLEFDGAAGNAMSEVADGVRDTVITTSPAEPHGVVAAVKDSGAGSAPDSLERIFNAREEPKENAAEYSRAFWTSVASLCDKRSNLSAISS